MSYILHFTVTGNKEYERIANTQRAEYIVLIDGELSDEELEEQKQDTVNGFECDKVIDLELDTDLSMLPTERALISST